MNFYENIISLLKDRNISQNQMINDLKLARNTMYNWSHRKNIPSGIVLLKLSDYFNVSVDYLLDNKRHCISDSELLLLNKYRHLTSKQQEILLKDINEL